MIEAAQFGVGRHGERTTRKQGQPRRCKLEAHRDYLLGLIAAEPDSTISELRDRLLAERGVSVSRSTLWTFLDGCGQTYKKRPGVPASRSGRM